MRTPLSFFSKALFCCLGVGILGTFPLFAKSYRELLVPGLSFSYEHWNEKKQKITGLSHYQYLRQSQQGEDWIIEKNENTKPDGKAFTQKETWFEAQSGELKRYHEIDLRNQMQIESRYENGEILTRLSNGQKIKELKVQATEALIPLETIHLYLRTVVLQLQEKKELEILLYIPLLAFDLEERGLPSEWSQVTMQVQNKGEKTVHTPQGEMKAIDVLVRPASGMIRTLLDKSKTNFRFTIALAPPYYILGAEEGSTQHRLIKLEAPGTP